MKIERQQWKLLVQKRNAWRKITETYIEEIFLPLKSLKLETSDQRSELSFFLFSLNKLDHT